MTIPRIVGPALCALLLFAGCGKKTSTTKVINSKHVKIGFIGLTCEAPIYAAYEKGFFKDEGLEPELVKCSWAAYKDNLALGSYDITHHLVMYFLKPIEQGLDVRFLGGVHTRMPASPNQREQSDSQNPRFERKTDWSSRDGYTTVRLRQPGSRNPRGRSQHRRLNGRFFRPENWDWR